MIKNYKIIEELHANGHIIEKLKNALIGIKDIGNDGAHINDNEPDIGQATKIRHLIDTILKNTVISDSELDFLNKAHEKEGNQS